MKTRGITTYVRILALSLGLILTTGAVAHARGGDSPGSSSLPKNPSSTTADVEAASDDAIGSWVSKNADRLGLYMDETGSVITKSQPSAGTRQGVVVRSADLGVSEKRTSEPTDVIDLPPKEAAAQIKESLDQVFEVKDACDNFVNENGFGPLGQLAIRETLKSENRELIEGPMDVRSDRLCPNFDSLSTRSKAYFWVFVKSAMSFLESSCDPLNGSGKVAIVKGHRKVYKKIKGPNGFATGLFALHEGREDEYGAQNCKKNDSKSAPRSIICGVSMLTEQIKRRFNLFTNNAHFGVLLPKGDNVKMKDGSRKRVQIARGIVAGIRMLPFCGYKGPGARRTLSASQSQGQGDIAPRASSYNTVQ